MWVYEEEVEGRKLSELVNERHENVKYLPGVALPGNIVTSSNLEVSQKRTTPCLVFSSVLRLAVLNTSPCFILFLLS